MSHELKIFKMVQFRIFKYELNLFNFERLGLWRVLQVYKCLRK